MSEIRHTAIAINLRSRAVYEKSYFNYWGPGPSSRRRSRSIVFLQAGDVKEVHEIRGAGAVTRSEGRRFSIARPQRPLAGAVSELQFQSDCADLDSERLPDCERGSAKDQS